MKVIKVILGIIAATFLIVGIPIIINECYKANCGYITVWDGADVLGYYGAILGSIIAVATLAITIIFTKKQIQRDSFLKNENEKWDRLKAIFMQTLSDINPMRVLKDVMDIPEDEILDWYLDNIEMFEIVNAVKEGIRQRILFKEGTIVEPTTTDATVEIPTVVEEKPIVTVEKTPVVKKPTTAKKTTTTTKNAVKKPVAKKSQPKKS